MTNQTIQYNVYQTSKWGVAFLSREEDENVIDLKDDEYKLVYEGTYNYCDDEDDISILENLYTLLNTNHPTNYHARSLSVSDIVQFENKTYICESFGWKEITLA